MANPPIYDPLVDRKITTDYAASVDSHWNRTLPSCRETSPGPLPETAPWVIIGAGYTGLNAARCLAEQYGQAVIVLEAAEIGAGCSSRNAGFVLPGSGRLSLADYRSRFGESIAHGVESEFRRSVDYVRERIELGNDECEWQTGRYLRVAHSKRQAHKLQRQPQRFLSQAELQSQFPGLHHAYGALQQEPAASVQPKALVRSYARQALRAGVKIYTHTPVQSWKHLKNGELLTTPHGTVQAQQVLVCSNAYTASALLPDLTSRHLPALSSVLVSAPLAPEQLVATGLSSRDLMMDTRSLKYYYRLLPDKRLLFGGRGAVTGRQANQPGYKRSLIKAMEATWPCLRDVEIESYWHGWVSVSLDSMPRVFSLNQRIHASMGYCGAGIAFASLAGRRLAQRVMGEELPELPFYQSKMPRFPAPAFRRLGQTAFYQYAKIRDRLA